MDFNVNVNVKLSLDSELTKLARSLFTGRILQVVEEEPEVPKARTRKKKEHVTPEAEVTPAPTSFDPKDPSPIQTVTDPVPAAPAKDETSDLPFPVDEDTSDKPLPFVAIWLPEDARKARKANMDKIESSVPDEVRESVHKQMVKTTKLYLQSAAYKHERNEMGIALNKDGLPVKKLDELDSDEILRFMYLCESMFYSPEDETVYPFEELDDVLGRCPDWSQVERDFVKTYNKK